jgi:hypothetical protein
VRAVSPTSVNVTTPAAVDPRGSYVPLIPDVERWTSKPLSFGELSVQLS